MLDRGPRDAGGEARFGHTKWQVRWRWDLNQNDRPNLETVRVACEADVLLPRLASRDTLDARLLKTWDQFINQMDQHELNHVRNIQERAPQIAIRIRNGVQRGRVRSPATANKIANNVLLELRSLDRQYDQRTNHGKSEGVIL